MDINEEFEHKIDFLTKEDIDYLENEKMCFKIYASEQIEKKGKTPIEEILKNIKEEEDMRFSPKINNGGKELQGWDIMYREDVNKEIQNNNIKNENNTNNAGTSTTSKKGKKKGCYIF